MENLLPYMSKSQCTVECSGNLHKRGAVKGGFESPRCFISSRAHTSGCICLITRSNLRFSNIYKLETRGNFNGYPAFTSLGVFYSKYVDESGKHKGFRLDAKKQKRNWFKKFLFDNITLVDFPSNESYESSERSDSGVEFEGEDQSSVDDTVTSNGNKTGKDDPIIAKDDNKRNAFTNSRKYEDRESDAADKESWEDWLDESWKKSNEVRPGEASWYEAASEWEKDGLPRDAPKVPERGMIMTVKELFWRFFEKQEEVDKDLKFEERVNIFTSRSTAKFATCLLLIPWVIGYFVHDFAVIPFLNRYVEKVPLAAKSLDVRESQKLKMIEALKLERQRLRLEAAIGKAPPLTDEELIDHLRDKAHELREEVRAENRNAFANLWSDLVAGITLLLLLLFNPNQVAIMKLTGNRLFTSISDTGKAFIIILLSDIFLGYHSETGWETVIEIFLEHYGFEVSQASIYVFVAIVPVTIDACFKLWVFRYLTRLSSSAAATFRAMKRH